MNVEIVEKIIEAVKANEILYKIPQDGVKPTKAVSRKWDEIAATLGLTGDQVKKKWKGLRDSYTKHLRSLKVNTGETAKQLHRYKSWPWASQLSFLKQYMDSALTEPNQSYFISLDEEYYNDNASYEDATSVSAAQQDLYDGMENSAEPDIQDTTSLMKFERKRRRTYSTAPGPSNLADNENSQAQYRDLQERDEIDLMFLSFAKTVKNFSAQRKAIIKAELAQYIMEQELAHLRESEEVILPGQETY